MLRFGQRKGLTQLALSSKDTGYGGAVSGQFGESVVLTPNLRSKIIENLAVVNYDSNNLHLAPYDWRLSFWNLEERDGYFSKLKSTIEGYKWVTL